MRPEECAYFQDYGPAATSTEGLVRVAGAHWAVEEGFAQAREEVGLDHHVMWHWEHGIRTRPLVPLSMPEVRRLLLALRDDDQRTFRLGWSHGQPSRARPLDGAGAGRSRADEHVVDCGYTASDHLVASQTVGTDLLGPIHRT